MKPNSKTKPYEPPLNILFKILFVRGANLNTPCSTNLRNLRNSQVSEIVTNPSRQLLRANSTKTLPSHCAPTSESKPRETTQYCKEARKTVQKTSHKVSEIATNPWKPEKGNCAESHLHNRIAPLCAPHFRNLIQSQNLSETAK